MGFRGGYRFKNFEGAAEPVLKSLPVPGKVVIDTGGMYASMKMKVKILTAKKKKRSPKTKRTRTLKRQLKPG